MLTENKNILIKSKSKKGFTLVELIIVITILAILATIAFVSFQGYTKNTRDATRLASMNSMSKGLEIYLVKNSTLPHPETPVVVYDNSETIGYQGYFGDDVARLTGFDKNPKDPLDGSKYTYLTSSDYKKYQILSLMETSDYLTFSNDLFTKTFADGVNYSKRIPKTIGYELGVLLGTGTSDMNRPIQEKLSASFTGVNIDTNTSYKAVINNTKTIDGGKLYSLKNTIKNGYDASLISYWDMETSYMSGSARIFKNFVTNGSDCKLSNSSSTGGIVGLANRINNTISDSCSTNLKNGNPFSISYYYKLNNEGFTPAGGTGAGLFTLQESFNNLISLYKSGSTVYVGTNKNSAITNKPVTKIDAGKWYSINIIYDGNKYDLYINGELLYSITSIGMNNPSLSFQGSRIYDLTHARILRGDVNIDEVKIYNKALSNIEIQNLYNKIKN